jgi:acyl-CoA synthetase (AMP-forming)/AMP-acid ligase II
LRWTYWLIRHLQRGDITVNIVELLRTQSAARPHAAAIIDTHRGHTRITTFAALEAASAQLAARLQQAGLRQGDVVLVFVPMSAELYSILGALFRLGLVAMFIDPAAGAQHIAECCKLAAPRALIAGAKAHALRLRSPELRRIPKQFVTDLPLPGAIWLGGVRGPAPLVQPMMLPADAPALITFTSGSTGQPRAAVRSHGLLLAQYRALSEVLQPQAGTVDLATMPIVLLANLAAGVTSLIPRGDLRYPGQIAPAPVVEQIQTFGVRSTVASPALLEQLVNYCLEHGIRLPRLRALFSGGAPVFPHVLDQIQAIAPQAEVTTVYGSTEAEPIAHIARQDIGLADRRAMYHGGGLLVGHPASSVQVRVLPDRWGRPLGPYSAAECAALDCPPGQVGEIVVSGAHVLESYLAGHGNRETKFAVSGEIWHRTGDAGYFDEQGRLWLLGRCAARIDDQHGTLYPFAVECAAAANPMVRRAAAVAHQGRRVLLVECCRSALATVADELRIELAWAELADIRCAPRLPVDRRHNAKIDYPALQAMVSVA